MELKLEKIVTFFLFPAVLFPSLGYLLYVLLSIPLGWVLVPALALLALLYHYVLNNPSPVPNGDRYNVVVVGAGVSGLIAGARLKQQGVPFTILEAGGEVGGCEVPDAGQHRTSALHPGLEDGGGGHPRQEPGTVPAFT